MVKSHCGHSHCGHFLRIFFFPIVATFYTRPRNTRHVRYLGLATFVDGFCTVTSIIVFILNGKGQGTSANHFALFGFEKVQYFDISSLRERSHTYSNWQTKKIWQIWNLNLDSEIKNSFLDGRGLRLRRARSRWASAPKKEPEIP